MTADAALADGEAMPARVQYAALPFRRLHGLEVLLVSSRETRRWVLPKGWPIKGLKPHASAAREAFEEAGVEGKVSKTPIGRYRYDKRLADGSTVPCEVEVYPLEVVRQKAAWPEKGQRATRWFTPREAATAVVEPGLADLFRAFSPVAAGRAVT